MCGSTDTHQSSHFQSQQANETTANHLFAAESIMKFRINKFLSEVSSLSGSRVISLGLSILSSILLTRLLGPDNKGIITTLLVIPGLVTSFSDLGVRQATTFFLGKKIYDDEAILSTSSFLFFITSIISIIAFLIFFTAGGYGKTYNLTFISVIAILIPCKLIQTYCNGVLVGKRKIHELSFSIVITEIIYLLLVCLLYFLPKENQLLLALLAELFSTLLTSLFVLKVVLSVGKIRVRYIPGLPWAFIKKGFLYAVALFILGLNYNVDILILGRLTNTYEIGIYSVGVGFANLLWLLPTAITTVNFSHSANSSNKFDYAKKTAKLLRITLWLSILPVIVLFFSSKWVMLFLYGAKFQTSGLVVQAILPGVWMTLIFKILNSDLAGRGYPHASLWVYGLATVINIILNFWWDPLFGALGAAWASTVSYSVGAVIFLFTYSRLSQVSIKELTIIRKQDFHNVITTA
jgi:O-antigen/teichoic acid export membrane protein